LIKRYIRLITVLQSYRSPGSIQKQIADFVIQRWYSKKQRLIAMIAIPTFTRKLSGQIVPGVIPLTAGL
jgi:hypothetical protein